MALNKIPAVSKKGLPTLSPNLRARKKLSVTNEGGEGMIRE